MPSTRRAHATAFGNPEQPWQRDTEQEEEYADLAVTRRKRRKWDLAQLVLSFQNLHITDPEDGNLSDLERKALFKQPFWLQQYNRLPELLAEIHTKIDPVLASHGLTANVFKDAWPACNLASRAIGPGTQSLEKFELFPLLPAEIRLRIWKFSRPDPQIIRLKRKTRFATVPTPNEPYKKQERSDIWPDVYSVSAIPAMVHACYESRHYAMHQWYSLSIYHFGLFSSINAITYFFDPTYDFVYIGCDNCLDISCRECFLYIRVAIANKCENVIMNGNLSLMGNPFYRVVTSYRSAKEIILLRNPSLKLKHNTKVTDLQDCAFEFVWQNGKSLVELHEEQASLLEATERTSYDQQIKLYDKRLKQVERILDGEETVNDQTDEYVAKIVPELRVEGRNWLRWRLPRPYLPTAIKPAPKIWAAELAPSKATSDIYGFLQGFFAETFFF